MKNNPISDYFQPGVHHKCMFCGVAIARLRDGALEGLGNKAHVLMPSRKGGIYIINCCGDCAKTVDFRQLKVRQAVHRAVIECHRRLNPKSFMNPMDTPRGDLIRVELDSSRRPEHVSAFKEFYASKL